MRYWLSILLGSLCISVPAQEYRDAKSWLNDMVNSEFVPSGDLIEYHPILDDLISSISRQEMYKSEFKIESSQFQFSYKPTHITKWDKGYYQPYNMKSLWKPTKKLFIEGENFTNSTMFCPKNLIGTDLKVEYKLTDKLSLNLHGYYIANDYKNPTLTPSTLYKSEFGGNLSYNITKNLKIKTGMQYQYNVLSRHWEYMYLTGIAFSF